MIRRTVVCRNKVGQLPSGAPRYCNGGGWWGEDLPAELHFMRPARCPRCGGRLTELAPTLVYDLGRT